PTIDPEALKTLSMQMVLEQKIRLTLHSWAVEPVIERNTMRGAIFESKEGRQAILAKVVIDTTGDADLLARAGLPLENDIDDQDIHHCVNTAFLLGGVDMERWIDFRSNDPQGFSEFMARGRRELGFFENGLQPRNVDPRKIQCELLKQGVYLSPAVEAAANNALTAAE
ncbi:MAG: FAD-dependent oxidoreductase, partial [Pseudolabrys sp.]